MRYTYIKIRYRRIYHMIENKLWKKYIADIFMSVFYPNYEWLLLSQAKNLELNKTKKKSSKKRKKRASSNKNKDRIFQTNSIKASNQITINFAAKGVVQKKKKKQTWHTY